MSEDTRVRPEPAKKDRPAYETPRVKVMTEREILDKLRGCLEFGGYPPSAAERLLELASGFDSARDAGATLVEGFPEEA